MPSLKHRFHSPKGDGTDSSFVKPGNWNDEHDLVTSDAAVYLGRDATEPGDVQEFPIDFAATGDDFTMMTKAQVQAAIAAAIGGLDVAATGDLFASFNATKTGCLLLDGRTIGNVGSPATFASAAAQNLFNLLWAINGGTWPVVPSRGASALADWTSGHTIAVPDARGCVIGMLDLAAGITPLLATFGTGIGASSVSLTIPNLPAHHHSFTAFGAFPGEINTSGGGANFHIPTTTDDTGGDPAATPPFSVPVPVSIVQPTIGANLFIKL